MITRKSTTSGLRPEVGGFAAYVLFKNWLYRNNEVGHDADTLLIHLFGRRVGGLGEGGGTTQVRPLFLCFHINLYSGLCNYVANSTRRIYIWNWKNNYSVWIFSIFLMTHLAFNICYTYTLFDGILFFLINIAKRKDRMPIIVANVIVFSMKDWLLKWRKVLWYFNIKLKSYEILWVKI